MFARRILLGVTAAIGVYVGLWAAVWPTGFYDAFPGFGRIWVAVDGPFNEHLIRDVGALYLGLAVASIAAAFARDAAAARVVGVAWTVFGLPHLLYHVTKLGGMATVDAIGNVVSLGGNLALGILLMLPGPRETIDEKEDV
ncbi:hypothetical protein [Microbacterium soli]